MRRSWIRILPLLLSALACSALQTIPTPEPIWTYTNQAIRNNGFNAPLQTDETGNIYTYFSSDGFSVDGLLGLNGATGLELWSPTVNPDLTAFNGVYGDRAIFRGAFTDEVNSDDMVLFTVITYDLQTAKEVWRYVGLPNNASINVRGNYAFAWKSSTEMDILDLQSGKVLSTYTLDVDPAEFTDLNPGWVRFIYSDSAFYSLSPAGILREYSLPDVTLVKTINIETPYFIDTYLIENDSLYLYAGYEIGQDTSLLAYDLASGQKRWELKDMYGASREIQFYNGLGYLNTPQGASAIDLNTGQVLWSTGSSIVAPYVIDAQTAGKLLVADSGSMSAYDAQSGEKVWSFKPGLDNVMQVTAIDRVAFVISGDDPPAFQSSIVPSRLDAVDIESGKSIWRVEQPWIMMPVPAGEAVVIAYEKGISAYPIK